MFHQFKILIVDDDFLEAKLLIGHLSTFGYKNVTHVHDSDSALNLIEHGDVDFIIMDIELNGSKKNGIQLVEEIRQKHQIPTLFLSNHSSDNILDQMNNVSEFDFRLKPIEPEHLDHAIRRILKRHTLQEEESDIISLETSDVFFLKQNAGVYSVVRKKEITYLMAENSGTTIHHGNKKSFIYISLVKMAAKLKHLPLVRTHQKYAVAVQAIESISDAKVTLVGGNKVDVSRNYGRAMKSRLQELIVSS